MRSWQEVLAACLRFPCSYCGAVPGEPCRARIGRKRCGPRTEIAKIPHMPRFEALHSSPKKPKEQPMMHLGDSPCFVSLARILDENPKLKRKVTYRIHEFRAQVKSLRAVENPRHREGMLALLRERFLLDIAQMGWPSGVKSRTANCLTAIYRVELRGTEGEVKEWNRARREQSRLAGGG